MLACLDRTELRIETGSRLVTDLSPYVERFCRGKGDGLLHLLAPHATAGLALMELGSGSEEDLAQLVERILPRGEPYVHRHGSAGHGRDHLLPAFISPSLVLAVADGRVELGTWQRIALVDSNADNPVRTVRFSFVAG
jgi:secondary thiamine-phosphate synthase enzyme